MSELFDMDARELIKLRKWYKKQPNAVRKATGSMLNEFAFGTRASVLDILTRRMTIRNPRFLASKVRVTKARLSAPISSQRAVVGTLAGARFSGFVEQEKGARTDRTRVASLLARSGSRSSQIKPRNRLKQSNEVITMNDYDVSNVGAFVAMIFERKETRLIRIKGTIYRRKGKKKLQVVQRIKPPKVQPKKRPFMVTSRKLYFNSADIPKLWAKTLRRYIKR